MQENGHLKFSRKKKKEIRISINYTHEPAPGLLNSAGAFPPSASITFGSNSPLL